jgi:hypothetical protein
LKQTSLKHTKENSTMNITRFLIAAPIVLTTMIAPNLTAPSQAKPSNDLMLQKRYIAPTTVTGYISDVNGTYNVPCTDLKVRLIERRQTGEQAPGTLFPPYKETVLATSTGTLPDGTCQYKMTFRQGSPAAVRYTSLRTYTVEVSGDGYRGQQSYDSFEQIPDGFVFSVVAAPEPIIR